MSADVGGCRVLLKREDLCHTGSHKLNNTLGQILLARRMGKKRIIAETGAGQHGVATATVAALFGLPCDVYKGALDVQRQALNVFRMQLLGARVIPVQSGSRTLKDAMNEALRDWVTNVRDTYYIIGSVAGPHPYPALVREFQSVIGREARRQVLELSRAGCPTRWWPAWAAAPTPWASSAPSSTTRRCGWWRGGGRPRPRHRQATAPRWRGARPASCTARAATCSRTRTARSPRPTPSAPASTTPASAPSSPGSRTRAGSRSCPRPTRRRWTSFQLLARLGGDHPGAGERPRGGRRPEAGPGARARRSRSW